ncbi:MAG: isochorismatase family cysteine hydrolase [Gaiellaceae bacterium]
MAIEIHGKTVLTTIPELVDPAHAALLIIDVQNDCCAPGGAFAERGADLALYQDAIPQLKRLVAAAREAGALVIYVQATTLPDHRSQSPAQLLFEARLKESYPRKGIEAFEFCLPGTWGHEFVGDLRPEDDDVVIQKHRSSAFVGTNLDLVLRSNGIKTVIATGCTTEGCVDSTIRDAGFLDYYPIAVRDCIASDNRRLHEAALAILEAYRAVVTDSAEIIEAWSAQSANDTARNASMARTARAEGA